MRHPHYRRRFRPRANFVRPRFYRIRADLVELVELALFAILIDLRNDPVPQTGSRRSWRDTTPGWMQSLSSDIAVSGAERTWRELGQCSRDIRQLCRRVKTGPAAQHTGLELRLHLLEGWAVECAVACDIAVKAIRANKRDTQGSDKRFFARVLEVRASVSAGLKKPSAELQVLEHVEEIGGVK